MHVAVGIDPEEAPGSWLPVVGHAPYPDASARVGDQLVEPDAIGPCRRLDGTGSPSPPVGTPLHEFAADRENPVFRFGIPGEDRARKRGHDVSVRRLPRTADEAGPVQRSAVDVDPMRQLAPLIPARALTERGPCAKPAHVNKPTAQGGCLHAGSRGSHRVAPGWLALVADSGIMRSPRKWREAGGLRSLLRVRDSDSLFLSIRNKNDGVRKGQRAPSTRRQHIRARRRGACLHGPGVYLPVPRGHGPDGGACVGISGQPRPPRATSATTRNCPAARPQRSSAPCPARGLTNRADEPCGWWIQHVAEPR